MEALILLATPVVASWLTEQVKRLKTVRLSTQKAAILQFLALTFSFVGVIGGALATGAEIPVAELETYISTVLAFATTQVIYRFGKQS